ncbi:Holliday junction branch migration protein RuvA [Suttonella ornithocola]|uniref:Holliday junction branch migration complex subunit RuvA n=1 Tax=Suttonella ornithocola TaxID=279832 RepID=A0A380MLY2_9GAMM|nr:Holliday junction branch migration protein RuvA [Suttonella ornithocola]SUO93258.1 Holliday junction ATP-dependent DNA helicase RuvA [Suttonella ornithocola]
MIGWLQGTVVFKQANQVMLNVGGVGYEISVPVSVIEELHQGQTAELFIHHAMREDGQYLYGFSTLAQRALFRELIRVSGIGPKLGLLILSGFSVDGLVTAIREQNSAALVKLPGIGKKTAERLLIDLKDRVGKQVANINGKDLGESHSLEFSNVAPQEALEALVALELKPSEAAKLVDAAVKVLGEEADTAALIKIAFALKLQGAK